MAGHEAGLSGPSLPTDFADQYMLVGHRHFAVDILTSIRGISFAAAWPNSELRDFQGLPVRVIGLEALLENKRATARAKDLADAEELEARRRA